MKKNFLYFLLSVLAFISCKKEAPPDLYDQTGEYCKAENMVFKCEKAEEDEVYFTGKINGEEFCVSYPGNGGFLSNSIWSGATTSESNPTLTPNTPITSSFFGFMIAPKFREDSQLFHEDFDPFIILFTPRIADSVTYPATKYLDDFIQEGNLPLMSIDIDQFSGFEFRIAWSCVFLPGYEYYDERGLSPERVGGWVTPILGKQPDAIFRVSHLEKVETILEIHYDITFEIECDLYTQNVRGKDTRYFGRLEDGVYRTKFSVPK